MDEQAKRLLSGYTIEIEHLRSNPNPYRFQELDAKSISLDSLWIHKRSKFPHRLLGPALVLPTGVPVWYVSGVRVQNWDHFFYLTRHYGMSTLFDLVKRAYGRDESKLFPKFVLGN